MANTFHKCFQRKCVFGLNLFVEIDLDSYFFTSMDLLYQNVTANLIMKQIGWIGVYNHLYVIIAYEII